MGTEQQTEIVWERRCKCRDATATAPSIRIDQGLNRDNLEIYLLRFTYSPGPHCDKCGEPWRLLTNNLERKVERLRGALGEIRDTVMPKFCELCEVVDKIARQALEE